MTGGEETQITEEPGRDDDELRRRAIEMGFLNEDQASEVFNDYRNKDDGGGFGSFLLEKGFVSVEQLGDLQGDEVADMATVIGDTSTGVVTSHGVDDATVVGAGVSEAPRPGESNISTAKFARPPDLAAAANPGQIEGGLFSGCRVSKKLGAGGMGSVYLAERESDKARVVVKFLAQEQAHNPTWRKRFVREAEVMKSVHHPNIIELYAIDGESDRPHIVMELVEGRELKEVLDERGYFEFKEGVRIIRDLARALAEAHSKGVIHRDIKPANALLSHDGVVKLLDFGLAKNTESDDGLSLAGQVLGTPHYMAPEQWGDHEVDARCDIFSLGATLYHMLTGTLPFAGARQREIARRALAGDFARPRDLMPDLSEDIELILFRTLEPDRRYRYASADQLADDLEAVLEDRPINVPRLVEETGARRGQRSPLVLGSTFAIGREPSNAICIPDSSVSRQHAEVVRSKLGYALRDLGSSFGTFVDDMRIREVVLKDGDRVRFGKTQFVFHDGGLEEARTRARQTRRLEKRALTDTALHSSLEALAAGNDRRVVMHLIEKLAPRALKRQVEMGWHMLRSLYGPEAAQNVGRRHEAALKRQLFRIPQQLFSITRENLGDDLERWLAWWDNQRGRYPQQLTELRPHKSKVHLKLIRGEPEPRAILLEDGVNEFTLGREESATVPVRNRSVSRIHATLLRFLSSFVIRDEGSRFGTVVNEEPVRIAFLNSGDQITLGKARLIFEESLHGSMAELESKGVYSVPAELYFALVEAQHPGIVVSLDRFLQVKPNTPWLVEEAARLFEDDEIKAGAYLKRLYGQYDRMATKARELLPKLLVTEAPADDSGWTAKIEAARADLPTQVQPLNWFPVADA